MLQWSNGDLADASIEDLRLFYEEACDEEVDLRNELRAKDLEAQQLSLRLEAHARSLRAQSAPVTALPTAGLGPLATETDQRTVDIQATIVWLAALIDLDRVEVLDVNFEVPMGGRVVQFRRVKQWIMARPDQCEAQLDGCSQMLRLTVPDDDHCDILALIAHAKNQNGELELNRLRCFAAEWDFIVGAFATAAHTAPEPSILFAHKESYAGILIATWPTREKLRAHQTMTANTTTPESSMESFLRHTTRQYTLHIGDRVEVEFEGKWYAGTLRFVDDCHRASVMCDADEPGVLTVTHLGSLRPLSNGQNPVRQRFWSEDLKSAATCRPVESSSAGPSKIKPGRPGHRRSQSAAL